MAYRTIPPRSYKAYTHKDLDRIPQLRRLSGERRRLMKAVAAVLPFRVNEYVVDELIRWDDVPDDPMYQLTFPQPGMLDPAVLRRVLDAMDGGDPAHVQRVAREIQLSLNPHPGGQVELNVPEHRGEAVPGVQHKYRETTLFFPSQGQTCHAYCAYCFRWPQFVGLDEMKFASREADKLASYLRAHPEISDVLFTGGDPLIMKTKVLRRYIEPIIDDPELSHVRNIRIGTKAMAYWPYRFVTDKDADDLLRLFEEVVAAGRHLAFMAHYSHPRELEPEVAREAVRRVVGTGAVMRCQAPLIRHVNDDAEAWAELWRQEVAHGAVPYYMFVERDTGAKRYFEVPLARAHEIFSDAFRRVSGLCRTVRGPSMSAAPGKVHINGVAEIAGEKVFVLSFLQARNPDWVGRPFFARYDEAATWLNDLEPAFGEERFFYQDAFDAMRESGTAHVAPGAGVRAAALANGHGAGANGTNGHGIDLRGTGVRLGAAGGNGAGRRRHPAERSRRG